MSIIKSYEEIELPFEIDQTNPEDFFDSVKAMLQGLHIIQEESILKANPLLKYNFFLHEVDHGSLKAKILKLIIIPDEANGELPLVESTGNIESYCNKVQETIINKCNSSPQLIVDHSTILDISKEIKNIAEETGVSNGLNYKTPDIFRISDAIENIQKATTKLPKTKSIKINSGKSEQELSKFYTDIDKDKLSTLVENSKDEKPIKMVIRIRKVDFLGSTKWSFDLEDGNKLEANILDEKWLADFHSRKVILCPGDSLKIEGIKSELKDEEGFVFSTKYIITRVVNVIEKQEK